MSNYPPGTSAGDPRAPWNAPDRSHDHEWRPCDPDYPILEDGAAIFLEACGYAEGRWGEGWECEETRQFRCDVERVVLLRDGKPDIAYLASEEDYHNEWGFIERLYEDALVSVEITDFEEIEILDCDPPNEYGDGYVRVRVGDKYEVVYEQ
ncbi:hypothetical protein HfxHF1_185 [Halophage HF1]|uniref:Uncharacterized protein n=2 Tax=Haloferacalesvirus TaxID=2843389 RepID=Q8V6T0_9CAUD|nr:hypothetical protein HrrHF2_185 [Halorubrum phage HF2]NP_861612.1 hypothetical protein HfxHF1_185 [Halophage HF1]AAL54946.1 hypothetical protein HrrHF2_185 [Halorubrum phage HF2]AAO61323.1 hypothetical protein HfxHF1_185 [Halophage HF1]QIR31131.1 hypothetical protein HrrHc2_475 [Halorubrum virus Hardycor2]